MDAHPAPPTSSEDSQVHVRARSGEGDDPLAGLLARTPALDAQTLPFSLGDFAIDEHRPLRVAVIGAGFSGIIAGIRIAQRLRNVQLVIYEKNAGVGGTWYKTRYPGLACDIPAHCYQLTFEENTQWSQFYAPGEEIRAYLERVVEKYKLMKYIKLSHEIVQAEWSDSQAKWTLSIKPESGDTFTDTADVVLSCMGGLERWTMPDIAGLESFEGTLMHTAQWDESVDVAGKRVAVIGVGSSAIQVVPAVQKAALQVDNYVRGKTWIAMPFASEELKKRDPECSNWTFTEEEKKQFRDDPEYYRQWRHGMESELNAVHGSTLKGSPMQQWAVGAFSGIMRKRLAKKPWIADHLIPDFPVACRRLTPGPGYLEALMEDNVDFVPTHIREITKTGIVTVDGKEREYDIIICATGYDTSWKYPFPIIGRKGATLAERWHPQPQTYLTLATDGFPNWFQTMGPNGAIGSGSLLVIMEREVDYVVAAIAKMQRERIRSMEVKREAVLDFDEYLENYFPQTVYSEKCRSWYKLGKEEGKITALWPGSCLHAVLALEHPRWEDYNYTYCDGVRNRFHWLGNGWTVNERDGTGDRAWYLNNIDYPPVPAE
ncbi:FAD/NAD(P)-binding domain-containing protein [Auricularia subglabra TFB-10046 SS5]|nr:FAD/NAD(P)-binding domain-containing protein [Auricularia subglabra TFB-10046 SS5]